MHAVLSLAAAVLAAPVPPAAPSPIEGKYIFEASRTTRVRPAAPPVLGGAPAGFTGSSSLSGMKLPAKITATRIAIEGRQEWEYTFDATAKPLALDLTTVPIIGKPTTALGIAEKSGDRLLIAYAQEGGERPKSFDPADGVTILAFKVAPPPPTWEYRIVRLADGNEGSAEREMNKLSADGFELVVTTGTAGPVSHLVLKRLKP